MKKEIPDVYRYSFKRGYEHKPFLITDRLHKLGPVKQWEILVREVEKAEFGIRNGSAVLFNCFDDTKAGGTHSVGAIYDPQIDRLIIEIPNEPVQKGGRFPSVLHAIEIAVATIRLAYKDNAYLPEIEFISNDLFNTPRNHMVVLIPLTVDPNLTNAVIFHPQARHISPEALAKVYYFNFVKRDLNLTRDLLRHTMLVQSRFNEDRPQEKYQINVMTLSKKEAQSRFNLLNPSRIAFWDDTTANRDINILLK
ncbi:MAG: hypothetical protein Q7R95_07995 [bacterium]|nr:hypothetical protein [bacterium]